MRKEDWIVGKEYKFIGGESLYIPIGFTVGESYKLIDEICFYEDDEGEPDFEWADALFLNKDGIPMYQDLKCFEVGEDDGV